MTYLLVSASAAVRVEYVPPEPTVIAPEGTAATTSLTKTSEDAIAAVRRMVTWDRWGPTSWRGRIIHSSLYRHCPSHGYK